MDILNQIKSNLDSNDSLHQNVKEEIFDLINLFHQTFPDVDLNTLNERIKNVKLGKNELYDRRGPVVYDVVNNEILLSKKSLEGDYDAKHLMMKGIIAMISSKDDYYGFNKNNSLYALTIGFTEMLAISKVIGRDIMFDAFFNNDAETIFKKLLEAEVG